MLPRRLLFATDFSPASGRAHKAALELARDLDADLTVLHVLEPPPYPYPISLADSARATVEEQLEHITDSLRRAGIRAERLLREGSAPNEITAAAQENGLDLVILGTHGRRGITHLMLGSVAERVVRLSTVPVLTVPSWRYEDRTAAGRALAQQVGQLRGERPLVFALSRGAIPIAHQVAQALEAPIDVLFVRQVQCDGEILGAVSEDGIFLKDDRIASKLNLSIEALGTMVKDARESSREESIRFRGARWIEDVTARTVIVVGDGFTTEWPFAVAAKMLRDAGAKRIVAASPAVVSGAPEAIARYVDEWACLERADAASIRLLYRDDREPSDTAAKALLSALSSARPAVR
jgi:predicted phosphoribosyltransferase/nucleotide-binding universal stress UspA family protein